MTRPGVPTIVSLLILLPAWLLGCGGDGSDPVFEDCKLACEGFSACEGEISTDWPLYFDVESCIEDFCRGGEVLVDPPGRGSEPCDTSQEVYLDCINGMTCGDWDDSDVVSVFLGSDAFGCEDEADDFVLDCIAMMP